MPPAATGYPGYGAPPPGQPGYYPGAPPPVHPQYGGYYQQPGNCAVWVVVLY